MKLNEPDANCSRDYIAHPTSIRFCFPNSTAVSSSASFGIQKVKRRSFETIARRSAPDYLTQSRGQNRNELRQYKNKNKNTAWGPREQNFINLVDNIDQAFL